jgi:hypothetical protein
MVNAGIIGENKMIKFTLFSTRTWCIISCAAVAALAQPASARERPGGPSNAQVSECGNYLTQPPAICVTFSNHASEPVRFLTEVTIDGQPVQASDLARQVECHNMRINDCTAAHSITHGPLSNDTGFPGQS